MLCKVNKCGELLFIMCFEYVDAVSATKLIKIYFHTVYHSYQCAFA